MNLKRIFRDGLVLVVFCSAFYGLTLLVGRLDGADSVPTDFSETRKRADRALRQEQWDRAASELVRLTDEDPFNGRAWYMLATSHYSKWSDLLDEFKKMTSLPDYDVDKAVELKERVDECGDKALSVFERSREFARYRANSLVRSAVIHSERDELDLALDYLKKFVEFGGRTQAGIAGYSTFGVGGPSMTSPTATITPATKLHDRREFWELVRKERTN